MSIGRGVIAVKKWTTCRRAFQQMLFNRTQECPEHTLGAEVKNLEA